MDSVRFGRVLGVGARLAARTVVEAVDAATSPSPAGRASASPRPSVPPSSTPSATPLQAITARPSAPASSLPGRPSPQTSSASARSRPASALWKPLARLSGVLWLEVSGVFFGLFALSAVVGAWRLRHAWRASQGGSTEHQHLVMTLAVALIFTWFCASSFWRARRRGRQL